MPSQDSSASAVPEREKRAADADRQQVADRLRAALDEGRLDLGEYDDRLRQTYEAKTYAELDVLLADIPGAAPASASQLEPAKPDPEVRRAQLDQARRQRGRRKRNKSLRQTWSGLGGATIFFTGIWAFTWIAGGGAPPYFWPIWVLGFWFVGAVCATWATLMKD